MIVVFIYERHEAHIIARYLDADNDVGCFVGDVLRRILIQCSIKFLANDKLMSY